MSKDMYNMESSEGVEWLCADSILAHTNPTQLLEKNILIVVKEDDTCWGRRVQGEEEWERLTSVKLSRSIFSKRIVHLTIKEGVLSGRYILTDDGDFDEQRVRFGEYIQRLKTAVSS